MNNKYDWDLMISVRSRTQKIYSADPPNFKISRLIVFSEFHPKQEILRKICNICILRTARAEASIVPEC